MTLFEIGEKIRARRRELHLTQEKLAELAGVSVETIGTIENGNKAPRLDTLELVAGALGFEIRMVRIG